MKTSPTPTKDLPTPPTKELSTLGIQTNRIPNSIIPELIDMTADGKTGEQLKVYLLEKYNIKLTPQSILNRIQKYREQYMSQLRQSIREAASKTALNVVHIIEEGIQIMHVETFKLLLSENLQQKAMGIKMGDLCLKYMTTKLAITGIEKENKIDKDSSDLLNGLLSKLGHKPA